MNRVDLKLEQLRTHSDRFWQYVEKRGDDDCWDWTGGIVTGGYGGFSFNNSAVRAHRIAFFLANGRFPMPCCLHHCDNRKCCNPGHLYEGSQKDNMRDVLMRERWVKGGEHKSSKLTYDDVVQIKWALTSGVKMNRIGRLFGVTRPNIAEIRNGKTWYWVKTAPLKSIEEKKR